MKAKGVSRDQARDRGNYAAGSLVMERIYYYDGTGLGPLASNSLIRGKRPRFEEVARCVRAKY